MSVSSYSGKEENTVHNLSLSYQAGSCRIRWKERQKERMEREIDKSNKKCCFFRLCGWGKQSRKL